MKGHVQGIEIIATGNSDFRRVLYTARDCQVVDRPLKPQEDAAAGAHKAERFSQVGAGREEAKLDGGESQWR